MREALERIASLLGLRQGACLPNVEERIDAGRQPPLESTARAKVSASRGRLT